MPGNKIESIRKGIPRLAADIGMEEVSESRCEVQGRALMNNEAVVILEI